MTHTRELGNSEGGSKAGQGWRPTARWDRRRDSQEALGESSWDWNTRLFKATEDSKILADFRHCIMITLTSLSLHWWVIPLEGRAFRVKLLYEDFKKVYPAIPPFNLFWDFLGYWTQWDVCIPLNKCEPNEFISKRYCQCSNFPRLSLGLRIRTLVLVNQLVLCVWHFSSQGWRNGENTWAICLLVCILHFVWGDPFQKGHLLVVGRFSFLKFEEASDKLCSC